MKEKQESPRRRCLLILIEKIPNAMKLTFLFLVISLLSFTATASAQRVSAGQCESGESFSYHHPPNRVECCV